MRLREALQRNGLTTSDCSPEAAALILELEREEEREREEHGDQVKALVVAGLFSLLALVVGATAASAQGAIGQAGGGGGGGSDAAPECAGAQAAFGRCWDPTTGNLVWEGATADTNEGTLALPDPGSDYTVTVPSATTTLAGLGLANVWTAIQSFSSEAQLDGGANVNVDEAIEFSSAFRISAQSGPAPDAPMFGVGTAARSIQVVDFADVDLAWNNCGAGAGAQADPTVCVRSANFSTDEYLELRHDQTNAVIGVGTGALDVGSASQILAPTGTQIAPGIAFAADTDTGFRLFGGANFIAVAAGNLTSGVGLAPTVLRIGSNALIQFSSGALNAANDLGLTRDSAGLLRVGDGSTGIGALVTAYFTEANTAGSGAPNALGGAESRTLYTNEGATAENHHDLPAAVAGLSYTFVVQDADGVQVNAAAGDTLRIGAAVSAGGGLIESTTVGNAVTLVAINASEWVAIHVVGTWTVT